ncbi:MAG: hypothetical protein MK098_09815, partial [Marinovum sp.]|nr:hypothetical protein [Marinovum sp.]
PKLVMKSTGFGNALKAYQVADERLTALKELEKTNPKFATVFDKVFPIVVNLSLAGANAQMGFADATKALDYVNTSLGLFNDVVGEIESNLE